MHAHDSLVLALSPTHQPHPWRVLHLSLFPHSLPQLFFFLQFTLKFFIRLAWIFFLQKKVSSTIVLDMQGMDFHKFYFWNLIFLMTFTPCQFLDFILLLFNNHWLLLTQTILFVASGSSLIVSAQKPNYCYFQLSTFLLLFFPHPHLTLKCRPACWLKSFKCIAHVIFIM